MSSKEQFSSVFHTITTDLLSSLPSGYNSDAVSYIRELINYTVPGGKMNRGLTVAAGLLALKSSSLSKTGNSKEMKLSEEELFRANVLGWCVEWLQAFFLVADDIMDGSVTRRGQPCWYKKSNVGLVAINDSFILESFVYRLITRYFGNHNSDNNNNNSYDSHVYLQLLETFHEVTFQTELGQLLDLTTQPPNQKINLDDFTMSRYKQIVEYKTSYYSFYLPVKLAMIMAGVSDKEAFATAQTICLEMGEYFQIQDDYLDCYGDEKTIGKIGTDIEDGKCSWLVVTALHSCNATPEQLQTIQTHYGKHDKNSVALIKELYKQLQMQKRFADFEDESAKKIAEMINGPMPTQLNKAIFQDLFNKIYKRSL